MNVTIPIYVEEQPQPDSSVKMYFVRPLFFHQPFERDENLSRAMNKLVRELRKTFDVLGKAMRHDELAAYCFAPAVEDHLLKFALDLGKQRAQCRFLLVRMEALGRRVVFSPNLPEFAFELERGESVQTRATEVLTEYFRQRERKGGEVIPLPDEVSLTGKAWTTTIDLDIFPPQISKPEKVSLFALLGGEGEMDGALELRRVGRCFDWLYPDELRRAVRRDEEVAALEKLLTTKDKHPVLLIGPRSVGKTALIEEFVFRKVERRRRKYSAEKNLWLLSPQRLISGMSYVGQWENRVLAILKEARQRRHILYFDDLLGLYQAGISASSDLSVAQVIKPFVERQEFQLLVEITPEAFRVLQERDRSFADMFQILRINEPTEDDTFRILLSALKQLEEQHECSFALEVLPTALDLQRRYVRDASFPGKAVSFLRQLAIKLRGQTITRRDCLREFQAKSGMSVEFLDTETQLERAAVVTAIQKTIVGQEAAIHAAADVICTAKARLNDPDRPLAAFLFLGPTGVGKTQCAKAIAEYLFGDAEKMLRFDMNEFIAASAVARLVGTFDQPEGLLTSAMRRQPFAVILLDEIEKAHRDVFDLLLQVLGEGRLTDALGRTADFTNALIILTSNLGVKQASSELGFTPDEGLTGSTYIQSAEKFFRPEFFNRLDRIVPFDRLSRAHVANIARHLITDVFAREGLMRRKCLLRVDDDAMACIIDEGYHPTLGARALKRAIERNLTKPVAAQLAPLQATTPTIIHLQRRDNRFAVHVQPLVQAEVQATLAELNEDPGWIHEGVDEFLARVQETIQTLQPVGAISLDEIAPEQQRYFALKEQQRRLHQANERLAKMLQGTSRRPAVHARSLQRPVAVKAYSHWATKDAVVRQQWKHLLAAQDINLELREMVAQAQTEERGIAAQLADVLREAALLHFLTATETAPQRALLCLRQLNPTRGRHWGLRNLALPYFDLFRRSFGLETQWMLGEDLIVNEGGLLLSGQQALTLARCEQGTHLLLDDSGGFDLIQAHVVEVPDGAEPEAVWEAVRGEPFPLTPVI
ncbi:MAG TPA: AAA family ATPase, partial [Blastocatellia bacterium]|nr:AAA family ATPase [Blastocatellia bacterium]